MTHTHTPGPWRVSGPRLTSLTAQPVHDVFIGTGDDSAIVEGPNAAVNAALISAAPDLLEALQELCALNCDWSRGTAYVPVEFEKKNNAAIAKARAAIARAKGQA